MSPKQLQAMPGSIVPEIEFNEKTHRYKVNGEFLPSVTTIIDATVPKNLSWWAMVIGVSATMALAREGKIHRNMNPEDVVTMIRNERLSVYHIRDEKGEEGLAVHKALEYYAKYGEIPVLTNYPENVHPKISALARFLLDYKPKILGSEIRVASLLYGYAGTYDLRVKAKDGGEGIIDLKTGKRIYPDSQFPQLAGYEQASIECGAKPSAFQAILHLSAEGEYHFEKSTDTFEDFRVLLDHYYSAKEREQRLKDAKESGL